MGGPKIISQVLHRFASGQIGIRWLIFYTYLSLFALSVALVVGLIHATRTADELARHDDRTLALNYITRMTHSIVASQKVQLTWDDAFKAAGIGNDSAWADTYLGEFLWTNFHSDRLFLVSPEGGLLRAWVNGKPALGESFASVAEQARKGLIALANSNSAYGKTAELRQLADTQWPFDAESRPLTRWSGEMINYRGKPAFLTIAAIVPDTDYSLLKRTPNHLVTVRFLDSDFLQEMGNALHLKNIGLLSVRPVVGTETTLRLAGLRGQTLGWLYWISELPGQIIVRKIMPLFGALIVLLGAVMFGGAAIIRRTLRTTHELTISEAQAQHNALHDAMSGLPNRASFLQRLEERLADCVPADLEKTLLVGYFDLDHFKAFNDTLGHHVGDELLRQVAVRVRAALPPEDFIARFGGDEFVLMRSARGGRAAADELGKELMSLFVEPFYILGNDLNVTASCGISWGPEHSDEPGELIRNADIALYRAKQRGRTRWRCFTLDMHVFVRRRREIEMALRRALVTDELSMAYQPIVSAVDSRIEGFEALLRWNHSEQGEIRPGSFIPIAEQTGLMIPLGNWILRRVFSESRDWLGYDISINLSPIQIVAKDFVKNLRLTIEEFDVDPTRFILEITEGVMLDRSKNVFLVLEELKEIGFRIALDDFGTGYSSLSYLQSFQFDRIKIDQSFVQNIEHNLDAQSILHAIVTLGRKLRMKVVAEGVETALQRHLVQIAGCQLIQGFLIWNALTADDISELIRAVESQKAKRSGEKPISLLPPAGPMRGKAVDVGEQSAIGNSRECSE